MSNAIQSFSVLHNNPFIFSPIFCQFYNSLNTKPKSVLLSYLVLPLVLYPPSHDFLVKAKSRSSVMSMAGKPGKRDRLFGLDGRVAEYREITNLSLQYAIDLGTLSIAGNGTILLTTTELPSSHLCPRDQIRAADRLGRLLTPFDVPTVYRMLGVTSL